MKQLAYKMKREGGEAWAYSLMSSLISAFSAGGVGRDCSSSFDKKKQSEIKHID